MSSTYKSGVAYPAYGDLATYSAYGTYTSNSTYPVTNLASKRSVRSIATFHTGSGLFSWAFKAVLAAAVPLQFFALIHHTLPAGATFRIDLFSDNNPDPVGNVAHRVYTTGYLDVWPEASVPAGFPAIRPLLLQNPTPARSAYVEIQLNNTLTADYDIGAFEMAGWWDWSEIQDSRTLGLDSRSSVQAVSGNIDMTTALWVPRVISGIRKDLDMDAELDTTCVDFARANGTWNPFVYVDDAYDPSSWPRRAFLARNRSLPASVIDGVTTGSFAFDLLEHLG